MRSSLRDLGAAMISHPTRVSDSRRTPDGMVIPGRQKFRAGKFDSFGDHRIAMAFAVASLACDGPSTIDNAGAASVSFPEFYTILGEVKGHDSL